MVRLADNQQIGNYTIVYFIKETLFCSSYRVFDSKGDSYFMKVFDISAMPKDLLIGGVPKEIETCKGLNHKNIIKYIDRGDFCD